MPFKVLPRVSTTANRTAAAPAVVVPQHFVPPSNRTLRAQAVHRLQFGLFGLCAMLLLVGLANIIMNRARLADTAHAFGASAEGSKLKNSDPLADIGVVPAADASSAAGGGPPKAP
jgi:hypothetical protein